MFNMQNMQKAKFKNNREKKEDMDFPSQAKLGEYAQELNLDKPFSLTELIELRRQVRERKKANPNLKKIHRANKRQEKVLENEQKFDGFDMRRSVIFADNGRAYIVHRVAKVEAGRILHYAGIGSFGQFKILQDVETGNFMYGVRISEGEDTVLNMTREGRKGPNNLYSDEEGVQRCLQRKVGRLKRERVGKAPKIYDVIERIPGMELFELYKKGKIENKDKPYVALALMFEVMNLYTMGIYHHDLKEENIIGRKLKDKNVWLMKSIDFNLSTRVDPFSDAAINDHLGGTSGYMDPWAGVPDMPQSLIIRSDNYALARILLDLFVPEALANSAYDDRTYHINIQKAWEAMGRISAAHQAMFLGLTSYTSSGRWDATTGFLEIAEMYPNQAREFLSEVLNMECETLSEALGNRTLPLHLNNNAELFRTMLADIKQSNPADSSDATIYSAVKKCRKVTLLNQLIKALSKYEGSLDLFGLTNHYKQLMLSLVQSDANRYSSEVFYGDNKMLFELIDFGVLTQNYVAELSTVPATEHDRLNKARVRAVFNDYQFKRITWDEVKREIDALTETVKEWKRNHPAGVAAVGNADPVVNATLAANAPAVVAPVLNSPGVNVPPVNPPVANTPVVPPAVNPPVLPPAAPAPITGAAAAQAEAEEKQRAEQRRAENVRREIQAALEEVEAEKNAREREQKERGERKARLAGAGQQAPRIGKVAEHLAQIEADATLARQLLEGDRKKQEETERRARTNREAREARERAEEARRAEEATRAREVLRGIEEQQRLENQRRIADEREAARLRGVEEARRLDEERAAREAARLHEEQERARLEAELRAATEERARTDRALADATAATEALRLHVEQELARREAEERAAAEARALADAAAAVAAAEAARLHEEQERARREAEARALAEAAAAEAARQAEIARQAAIAAEAARQVEMARQAAIAAEAATRQAALQAIQATLPPGVNAGGAATGGGGRRRR